eukprot:scaffold79037_cov19-Tisochrysis_lutea.AAC.1
MEQQVTQSCDIEHHEHRALTGSTTRGKQRGGEQCEGLRTEERQRVGRAWRAGAHDRPPASCTGLHLFRGKSPCT